VGPWQEGTLSSIAVSRGLPEGIFKHALRRVVDHLPVAVPKSVWTYNFGPSRLIYRLTFREGKLAHIETGGYGH
jgi:hypothetical protein